MLQSYKIVNYFVVTHTTIRSPSLTCPYRQGQEEQLKLDVGSERLANQQKQAQLNAEVERLKEKVGFANIAH